MSFSYDFVGFTFNGKHCIKDFKMYRTSNGSRYDDTLVPELNTKTADIPGGNGQIYFYTKYKTRKFSINLAFENLTEKQYREARAWLDGQEIHDLIFDEAPYKVYSASVGAPPTFKTVCFNNGNERVYKGEASITFTCHYPFAHTPNVDTIWYDGITSFDGKDLSRYNVSHFTSKTEWQEASGILTHSVGINPGDLPAPFLVTKDNIAANVTLKVADCEIVVKEACSDFKWDSKTGLVTGKVGSEATARPIKYTGKSYGSIPVGGTNNISLAGATLEYDYWYY